MKIAPAAGAGIKMTNHQWTIGGGRTLGPAPFLLMGILNLSPESFSDAARGAHHTGAGTGPSALAGFKEKALALARGGAGVVDLGGESTRPGAPPLSAEEECHRLLPVLTALRKEFSRAIQERSNLLAGLWSPDGAPLPYPALSVDTYKASTARVALEAGAEIINDISAWSFEPELKEVLLEHRPGYVLMHCQGQPANMQAAPSYAHVVEEVYAFLNHKLEELIGAGFPEERVVIDPGIGFGKNLEHNLALLRSLDRFATLGRPLLLGISYKSFLGDLTGTPLDARGPLSMAASALLAQRGAWAHRVHDVTATKQALQLAYSLAKEQ